MLVHCSCELNRETNTLKTKNSILEEVTFDMRVKRPLDDVVPSSVKSLEVEGHLPAVKVNITPNTVRALSKVFTENFNEAAESFPVLETSNLISYLIHLAFVKCEYCLL